jgi:CDP-diacylglycerol--serine O-phosphatidyltransferase
LPVPAAAGTVASLVLALLSLAESDRDIHRWAVALPPLLVLIAILMVSTVRYPSGKKVDLQTSTRLSTFVLIVVVAGALIMFKEFGLLACTLGYIFFGLIRHWRRARVARKQRQANSV